VLKVNLGARVSCSRGLKYIAITVNESLGLLHYAVIVARHAILRGSFSQVSEFAVVRLGAWSVEPHWGSSTLLNPIHVNLLCDWVSWKFGLRGEAVDRSALLTEWVLILLISLLRWPVIVIWHAWILETKVHHWCFNRILFIFSQPLIRIINMTLCKIWQVFDDIWISSTSIRRVMSNLTSTDTLLLDYSLSCFYILIPAWALLASPIFLVFAETSSIMDYIVFTTSTRSIKCDYSRILSTI